MFEQYEVSYEPVGVFHEPEVFYEFDGVLEQNYAQEDDAVHPFEAEGVFGDNDYRLVIFFNSGTVTLDAVFIHC